MNAVALSTSAPGDGETTDAALLTRAHAGDREAFAAIVERHKDPLVGYLTRLTGCRDRAEDLAQEAFVRLYTNGQRYREEGKLAPYLFRIGTNLLRSQLRRERRWRTVHALLPGSGWADREAQPGQQGGLLRREIAREVEAALAALPLRYRVPLVLYELEEWPYPAIARQLGCRDGTVKSRIHRARKLLRTALAPYWLGAERGGQDGSPIRQAGSRAPRDEGATTAGRRRR